VGWIVAEHRSVLILQDLLFTNENLLTDYGNNRCNAVDVALLRGHPKIATLLQGISLKVLSTFDILSTCMENVLENTAAVDAILEVLPSVTEYNFHKSILHLLHYMALSQAARSGDVLSTSRYIFNFDVEENLDIDQQIRPGLCAPLSRAIAEKNPALVRVLIEAGAQNEFFVGQFYTKIQATESGSDFLEAMLEEMIPNATWGSNFNAISEVLKTGNAEALKRIDRIAHRLAVESVNNSRANHSAKTTNLVDFHAISCTPLIVAILHSSSIQIKVLLAAETFPSGFWELDLSAWFAVGRNDLECLRSLAEVGADLTTRDRDSLSILDHAAYTKKWDIFSFLLQMSMYGFEIPCSEFYLKLAEREWATSEMDANHIKNYRIQRAILRNKS
jgi:hypothetical protein